MQTTRREICDDLFSRAAPQPCRSELWSLPDVQDAMDLISPEWLFDHVGGSIGADG